MAAVVNVLHRSPARDDVVRYDNDCQYQQQSGSSFPLRNPHPNSHKINRIAKIVQAYQDSSLRQWSDVIIWNRNCALELYVSKNCRKG